MNKLLITLAVFLFTAHVSAQEQGGGQGATGGGAAAWGSITGALSAQTDLNIALAAKAPSASPTLTGTVDSSGATHTLPAAKGLTASKPATCTIGEEYFATDATAGQNKYLCTATNTWTQQKGGSNVPSHWDFRAVRQGGIASATIEYPITTPGIPPTVPTVDDTHIQGEWQIDGTTTVFSIVIYVPAWSPSTYTLTHNFRASAASSGNETVQPQYTCVGAGDSPDNPTPVNLGSTFNLSPTATTMATPVAQTVTPTCPAGKRLQIFYTFTGVITGGKLRFSDISVDANP